ncbi:MAG: response regulator transcription factor [Chloroflexi bacterium]|nr:response regulator transcription factor [Chloroflexota bacterium]
MRVLLAEGRPDVRSALRLLLEQESGVTIESEVTRVEDLLAQLEKRCADLVLLDWELPGLKPENLLSSIHHCCPELKIIAISGRPESRKNALGAGADMFVSKADAPETLLEAISSFLNHTSEKSCEYTNHEQKGV